MQLLGDRYRLAERLGAGGMSVVWRGYDELLGRQVAVKTLAPRYLSDRSFREQIRHEALASARPSHPNIPAVYDYGEAPAADGASVPYVVMELVDGRSLAETLLVGPLPWRRALRVCADIAAALAAAHGQGVVHRDVTPANVLLAETGAKLVDFGISARTGEKESTSVLLGTPAYLAPERLAGGLVTPATDVYSLGVLLYQTLTGELPWSVDTTPAVLAKHKYGAPAPLPDLPGLPRRVAALYLRCLAKHPERRPGSGHLARALAEAARQPEPATEPVDAEAIGAEPVSAGPVDGEVIGIGAGTVEPVAFAADPGGAGPSVTALAVTAPVVVAPEPAVREPAVREPVAREGVAREPAAHAVAGEPAGRESVAREPVAGGPIATEPVLAGTQPLRVRPARRYLLPAAAAALVLILAGAATAVIATMRAPATGAHGTSAGARDAPVGADAGMPAGVTGCGVRYHLRNRWNTGFTADITLANSGTATITTWTLAFALSADERVSNGWNGAFNQDGSRVTVRDAGYNGEIDPGGSTLLGFNGSYHGRITAPGRFSLNGVDCVVTTD